jgi:hypothetical protein
LREVLIGINGSASPGLPLGQLEETKRAVIENHFDLLYGLLITRLGILADKETWKIETPEGLVQKFACDPVRVFIKNELHSKEKMESGRLRLIAANSLIDSIIERFQFKHVNDEQVKNWKTVPSKAGIALILDEDQQFLCDSFMSWIRDGVDTDVSGWDWSCGEFMIRSMFATLLELNGVKPGGLWHSVGMGTMHRFCLTLFATSDGKLIVIEDVRGIMKSGSEITTTGNGIMRTTLCHLTLCFPPEAVEASAESVDEASKLQSASMGDDNVAETPRADRPHLEKRYEKLGFRLTDSHLCEDGTFSFCSHKFGGGVAIPENHKKSFIRLLYNDLDDKTFKSTFIREHRKLPELDAYLEEYEIIRAMVGGEQNF